MSGFQNFVTPHCHEGSFDSGSTPERMVKREVELETGALTVSDHGTLANCPQVYKLAKKHGLTPIIGIEAFFRDDNCPILTKAGIAKAEDGTFRDYLKYMHLTMHALDQAAYETISRVLSRCDATAERHGSERKQLFTWADLEEICAYNVSVGSSCLGGFVMAHVRQKRPDIALEYYKRLRSLVKPGNFFAEVFPHRCTHEWRSGVFARVVGAKGEMKFWDGKYIRAELGGQVTELKAKDLAEKWKQTVEDAKNGVVPAFRFLAHKDYAKWVEYPEPLVVEDMYCFEDFAQNQCTALAPEGDIQLGANRFILHVAQKFNDITLVSDDSHFGSKEEKLVQDVRLQSSGQNAWRFYNSYHRMDSQEAFAYFNKQLNIDERTFGRWVQNSKEWASKFGWEWKPRRQLATRFYPADSIQHTAQLIKQIGRMKWDNPVYRERLRAEIRMLHDNGTIDLLPYLFVCHEVDRFAEANDVLPGPGRGSAAGLLLAYLLGITHMDPIKYGLSKERFLTEARINNGKLPDIDSDFGDRSVLFGGDVEQLEVEMADGTKRTVLKSQRVKTDKGEMTIRAALDQDADVLEWLP